MSNPIQPLIGTPQGQNSSGPLPTRPQTINRIQKGRPAGFWIRFVAVIVDGLVLTIGTMPLKLLASYLIVMVTGKPAGGAFVAATGVTLIIQSLITFGAIYFYYGYFYSTRGASPGKILMGLKVLNHSKGTYLTYGQTFLRETIGKIVSSITLGIGYLMVAFRSDKRALHDLIADSEVTKQS